MLVKVAHFVSIMLYVLVAGVMWGTWLSLARTMTEYEAATFLDDGKHMINNLGTVMAVLMIAAVAIGLVTVLVLYRHRSRVAGRLALAALALMLGVMAVTLAVEVPIDKQIMTWTLGTLPADWTDIRARWATFHTLRTFLSLASVAAAVAAALAPMTGTGDPD
jgi:drug/metabolite transporter (DMT)-like permease